MYNATFIYVGIIVTKTLNKMYYYYYITSVDGQGLNSNNSLYIDIY